MNYSRLPVLWLLLTGSFVNAQVAPPDFGKPPLPPDPGSMEMIAVAPATIWSREQAKAKLDTLVTLGFLTAKAPAVFFRALDSGKLPVAVFSPVTFRQTEFNILFKETILRFCADVIKGEFDAYAMGIKKDRERLVKNPEPSPFGPDEGIRFSPTDVNGFPFGGSLSPDISVTGRTLHRTLSIFSRAGLLDSIVSAECSRQLNTGRIKIEKDLLAYILERSTYHSWLIIFRDEQRRLVSSLVDAGILGKTAMGKIESEYQRGILPGIQDLLSSGPRYREVIFKNKPATPEVVYRELYKNIQQLIPGFSYKKFSAVITEKPEFNEIKQSVLLQFEADGYTYTQEIFHQYKAKGCLEQKPARPAKLFGDGFQKPVNRWLAEQSSPYRLFLVSPAGDSDGVQAADRVGLLLLTSSQAELIADNPYISRETYDLQLSRDSIAKFVSSLRATGLLSGIPATKLDSAMARIKKNEYSSWLELLAEFPGLFFPINWKSANRQDPYRELIGLFSRASRGALLFDDVRDEFARGFKQNAGGILFGFTLNGVRYEKELRFEGEWLDIGFLDLVLTAVKKSGVDGKYYQVYENGKSAGNIFLTSPQFEFLDRQCPGLLGVL